MNKSKEPLGTVFIFGTGILTFPGAASNWVGKAVTHTHLNGHEFFSDEFHAEKFEYFTGPLERGFSEKKRAAKLVTTMEWYAQSGWNIVLAGHSNMANVIVNALREVPDYWDFIQEIHLIAPACENDFEKNGLNAVKAPVFLYQGGQDKAVKLAATWLGRKLGYGSLGKDAALNATVPVTLDFKGGFGHSTWFSDFWFEYTMSKIINSRKFLK